MLIHVITVLNLAELLAHSCTNFIFLATLQLEKMVRTYQTVRKRRGNLASHIFSYTSHVEAEVSVTDFSLY